MKLWKVVLCGDGGVGKTSLARAFCEGVFNINERLTVGVQHFVYSYDEKHKVVIWDLGGEERFRFMAPMFLRGTRGALFVFDITREETFLSLDNWLKIFQDVVGDVPRVLVGNKVDLKEMRVVPTKVAEEYARKKGFLHYVETSARLNVNVDKAFILLLQHLR